MNEIKGVITEGETKSLTCCSSIIDVNIGDRSLFDFLEEVFAQNAEEYFEDSTKQSPKYNVKFVIMDEAPIGDKSFSSLAGQIITEMMAADYVSGCYSEYTCGWGGFDYVLNESRSIFTELDGFKGKWIHLMI